MKKHLLMLLGALIALPAMARDFTYTYEGQTLTYTVIDEAAKTVRTKVGSGEYPYTAGNTISGKLIIPSSVRDNSTNDIFNVIEIGERSFQRCSGLTSVSIPHSVTSIGDYAFSGCEGLTKAEFASIEHLCSIEFKGFESNPIVYAHNLYIGGKEIKNLIIPNSVTSIGERAFEDCSGLTSVSIPHSVTSIGYRAFSGCSGLTSVTIPNSVTEIGAYAFEDCSGLTSVSIGNSVTEILSGAFRGCSGLTSVAIPNSVTKIGGCAFEDCSGLTKAEFASIEHLCSIEFMDNYSNPLMYAHNLYIGGKEIKNLIIPNSVTEIGDAAFTGCSGLTSVTIPNSVTEIGGGAFKDCTGLTSVSIGNSVTEIGEYAFRYCEGLNKAEFSSIEHLCSIKFDACSNPLEYAHHLYIAGKEVKDVIIPNSVTEIGNYAFYGCSGLTSVTIPNSVTKIGWGAFAGCEGLTSVVIPNSVTDLSGDTFWGCTSLTSITISSSITRLPGEDPFYGCKSLTSVTYLAEEPLKGQSDLFEAEVYENATLNYLNSAEEKIAATEPWCRFKNRIGRDADFKDDSSITEVRNSEDGPTAVYDMRGVKVGSSTEGLPKGLYILRQGSTTRKIAI